MNVRPVSSSSDVTRRTPFATISAITPFMLHRPANRVIKRQRVQRDLLQWAVGMQQQRRRRLFVLEQRSQHNADS